MTATGPMVGMTSDSRAACRSVYTSIITRRRAQDGLMTIDNMNDQLLDKVYVTDDGAYLLTILIYGNILATGPGEGRRWIKKASKRPLSHETLSVTSTM